MVKKTHPPGPPPVPGSKPSASPETPRKLPPPPPGGKPPPPPPPKDQFVAASSAQQATTLSGPLFNLLVDLVVIIRRWKSSVTPRPATIRPDESSPKQAVIPAPSRSVEHLQSIVDSTQAGFFRKQRDFLFDAAILILKPSLFLHDKTLERCFPGKEHLKIALRIFRLNDPDRTLIVRIIYSFLSPEEQGRLKKTYQHLTETPPKPSSPPPPPREAALPDSPGFGEEHTVREGEATPVLSFGYTPSLQEPVRVVQALDPRPAASTSTELQISPLAVALKRYAANPTLETLSTTVSGALITYAHEHGTLATRTLDLERPDVLASVFEKSGRSTSMRHVALASLQRALPLENVEVLLDRAVENLFRMAVMEPLEDQSPPSPLVDSPPPISTPRASSIPPAKIPEQPLPSPQEITHSGIKVWLGAAKDAFVLRACELLWTFVIWNWPVQQDPETSANPPASPETLPDSSKTAPRAVNPLAPSTSTTDIESEEVSTFEDDAETLAVDQRALRGITSHLPLPSVSEEIPPKKK